MNPELEQERIDAMVQHSLDYVLNHLGVGLSDLEERRKVAEAHAQWFAAEAAYLRKWAEHAEAFALRMLDRISAARDVHSGNLIDPGRIVLCDECREVWPCRTILALNGGAS